MALNNQMPQFWGTATHPGLVFLAIFHTAGMCFFLYNLLQLLCNFDSFFNPGEILGNNKDNLKP